MRNTHRITLVVLAFAVWGRAALALETPVEPGQPTLVVRSPPATANRWERRMVRDAILDLQRGSATFRDLVRVIERSGRLLVFLDPSTDLRTTYALIGRTRFSATTTRVVAFVEVHVDPLDVTQRRLAIAHELAHVAEVACLGPVDSQDALEQAMARHLGRRCRSRSDQPIETDFAVAAGQAVLREMVPTPASESRFRALALVHRLPACPTQLEAEIVHTAEWLESGSAVDGN